jgi:hypothetical protein
MNSQNRKISFSKNWNNKLYQEIFTTIKPVGEYYSLGNTYNIFLKGILIGTAKAERLVNFQLDKLPPGVAMLDANLSVDAFQQMMKNMYSLVGKYSYDMSLSFIYLKWIEQYDTHPLYTERPIHPNIIAQA